MPENVTIVLNKKMLGVLDAALSEMPYRVAAPVVAELNRQIAEQIAQKPETSSE